MIYEITITVCDRNVLPAISIVDRFILKYIESGRDRGQWRPRALIVCWASVCCYVRTERYPQREVSSSYCRTGFQKR